MLRRTTLLALSVALLLLTTTLMVVAADSGVPLSGEKLQRHVVSNGGGVNGASSAFKLSGSAGQTAASSGSSSAYHLRQGFWAGGGIDCDCGDANSDGLKNITDAVFLIDYIFASGTAPDPLCQGDANGDGLQNITDVVYLIDFIFGGGPAPHCI